MTAAQLAAQAVTLTAFGVVAWLLVSVAVNAHVKGLARLRTAAARDGGRR